MLQTFFLHPCLGKWTTTQYVKVITDYSQQWNFHFDVCLQRCVTMWTLRSSWRSIRLTTKWSTGSVRTSAAELSEKPEPTEVFKAILQGEERPNGHWTRWRGMINNALCTFFFREVSKIYQNVFLILHFFSLSNLLSFSWNSPCKNNKN